MNKKNKVKKMGALNWAILTVLIIYCVLLFAFLIFGLFSSINTRTVYNHKIFFPDGKEWKWAFDNYIKVFEAFVIDNELLSDGTIGYADFFDMSINSVVFAFLAAFSKSACIFMVAYATTKFPYAFSKAVYTFVIVAMVIPIIGGTPSLIVIMKTLGMFENWLGVILNAFNFLGMYFLVVHAVLQGLPKDYAEAAYLDGAGEFTVMLKIMLPLALPTVSTIFLITFIENWNSYGYILIFLRSHPTLSYGVFKMSLENVNGMDHATMRMASAFLVAIPVLSLFLIFRNKIMKNVTMGGVKE
jgi:ABC-type glycerol-3-phosphate transport system permease component